MSDKKKTIEFNGWPGGLFDAANDQDALPTQLLQADNCVTDEAGTIVPRPGIAAGGLDYAAEIIDVIAVGTTANERYMTLGDKTLINPVETVLHTYSVVAKGQFGYFNGKYFHTNGVDAMQGWVTGSGSTADVLGAPLSRIAHVHNNRVFCANGQNLYETAPGTGPDTAVDNFATGASWAISTSDKDPIFAVASLGRDLYIFKNKTIWLMTGYTVNERQVRLFSSYYGCTTIESVRTVNIKGVGEAIIFLSDQRRLCAIYGGEVHEIGEAVRDILKTISVSAGGLEKVPANYYMLEARAVVNPNGWYMLGIATTAGGLPSTYTQCLVVNLNFPYQSQYGTRWPITLWKQTGVAGTFPITFGAMYLDELIYPKNVGCGMITPAPALFRLFVFNDSVEWDADANVPATYNLYPTIRTINHNAGTDQDYKQWFDAILYASRSSVANLNFKITQTNDDDDQPVIDSLAILAAPVAYRVSAITVAIYNDSQRCSITIKFNTFGMKLHRLELQYLKGAVI